MRLGRTGARHRVVGVEREFTQVGPDGPVDVRPGWSRLDLGRALDPGDPLARRTCWGGLVTADGREAEAATPPVPLRPGCTHEALDLAAAGRAHLAAALVADRPGHRLVGYSTHLSVEVPDRRVCAVARLVAERLAIPLMLVLDRADSPGLLVRPRHGRLEIGGEFSAGVQLRTALVVAVGIVLLAERATRRPMLRRHLPRPAGNVVPAVDRHGWYVDRQAFGYDLYAHGRDAAVPLRPTLRLGDRGVRPTDESERDRAVERPAAVVRAGELLATTWALARPGVVGLLDDAELELADHAVDTRTPVPLEEPTDDDGPVRPVTLRNYEPRRRRQVTITVEAASWHRAVVRLDGRERRRWTVLPGRHLDRWIDELDAGLHDAWLDRVAGDVVV